MAERLYVNNYRTALTLAITDSDTSMTVGTVTGIPTISGGDWLIMTLTNGVQFEIVQVTARSGNTFTIVRAQESTTALDWPIGTTVHLSPTADSFTAVAGGTPGGADTQVQYNSSGTFAGHSGLTYNGAGVLTSNAGIIVGGNATAAGYIRLLEDSDNGSNYTGFQSPASLAGNVIYTMPTADGTNGYVLSTNGSGTLSWIANGGGSQSPWTGNIDTAGYLLTNTSNADGVEIDTGNNGLHITGDYVELLPNSGDTAPELRLYENNSNGTSYTGFKAPAALGGNYIYNLPTTFGTNGYFLQTDGSGALTWAAAGSTYTGTTNEIDVTGTVISLAANPVMTGTDAVQIPKGTTAQRGTSTTGKIRYNSDLARYEGGLGTWTGAQFLIDGDFSSTGFMLRTAANTYSNLGGSQGDIIYFSGSNTPSTLAKNTSSTRYLSNTGSSNNPAWAQIDLSNGVTGVLPVANGGNGVAAIPMARAYRATNQTITTNTVTKITLDTESYDVGSCFDSSTNYRYTPNIAGKYLVTCQMHIETKTATPGIQIIYIYKNGAEYSRGDYRFNTGAAETSVGFSDTVSMNGSTDYLEIYCFHLYTTSATLFGAASYTFASFHLLPGG